MPSDDADRIAVTAARLAVILRGLASAAPRILIFTASIGEGHDGPARQIAAGISELAPEASVEVADFLELSSFIRRVVLGGSKFHSRIGSLSFELIFWLGTYVAPTRWLIRWLTSLFTTRPMLARIAASRPDVIVSTYPGATIALGDLRAAGRLSQPVIAAITDLAAFGVWVHPAVDVHLITHPESEAEVRALAPETEIVCVSGLTSPGFDHPLGAAEAKAELDLPAEPPVVVVSGGGWAVGDLEGAVRTTLERTQATVVCLCGRNEEVRARLGRLHGSDPRVVVLGFTDRMAELFAAADVVIHSTAGLTVLEALMRGCRVISYGWGHGHIRVNNRAFERFGLAEVAADPAELGPALERALAAPRVADYSFAELPSAASEVLARVR
jgi:processive 1,2-diacylglycerol beta-glucosyltransferase